MPDPLFTFTVDERFIRELAGIEAALAALIYAFNDFNEPLRKSLNDVILPSIDRNFASGGRPTWKKLSASTVEKRKATGPILDVSGALRKDATSASNWDISRDTLEMIGMSVEYGAFHQGGTRNMPARPFALLQDEDMEKIQEVFGLWVDTKIAEIWNE